jgi:nucleotide-binding universal stress UspA family protein
MEFKDIIVYLDESSNCSSRLDVAIRLARQHMARLTGLHVITHPYYESSNTNLQDISETTRDDFMRRVAEADLDADFINVDWSITGVSIAEVVTMYSRTFDLIIVGQTDFSSLSPDIPKDLPQQLVLMTGLPVLIVPYAGHFKTCGERIMLAWKAGRESVRAMNDALPFMIKADHVEIFTTVPLHNDSSPEHRCEELCTHLKRYNIKIRHHQIMETGIPVGDLIINRISDSGVDLLVTGTFSSSLSMKLKPGVVASQILKQMTVPVLMSH